jgi:hypothetical protein
MRLKYNIVVYTGSGSSRAIEKLFVDVDCGMIAIR